MEEYDAIIIGAGLSGCALGKLLLEKKQKVLIIEKEDINKKKLCGGLLTEKSYKLLNEIYKDEVKRLSFLEINNFSVKSNDLTLNFHNKKIYTIYRQDLDKFVIKQYLKSGGKLVNKIKYKKIDFKNKIIYTNNNKYKYNHLIGADGIFSQLRLDLTKKQQEKNLALETFVKKNNQSLQIEFLNDFKGYIWTIPNDNNTILGMGDIFQNINFKNKFEKHLKSNYKIKGAFLPTGNDILLRKDNVYFVGDAAGLIFPITGEGIYYALFSAYKLSNNINNNLYQKEMKKEIIKIKKYFYLNKLVYNYKLRNFLFKKYNKSKIITKLINKFIKEIL